MAKQRNSSNGDGGPKKPRPQGQRAPGKSHRGAQGGSKGKPKGGRPNRAGRAEVRVRKAAGTADAWELVHPRCAVERSDDLEEVNAILEAGEVDIAIDELRWLLSGCSDFLEAHVMLATLALSEDNDLRLARGHFGIAYQLGLRALRAAGMPKSLPYHLQVNQAFYEGGKGLAYCLKELGKPSMAREVLEQLIKLDTSDPLSLATMRDQLSGLTDTPDDPAEEESGGE